MSIPFNVTFTQQWFRGIMSYLSASCVYFSSPQPTDISFSIWHEQSHTHLAPPVLQSFVLLSRPPFSTHIHLLLISVITQLVCKAAFITQHIRLLTKTQYPCYLFVGSFIYLFIWYFVPVCPPFGAVCSWVWTFVWRGTVWHGACFVHLICELW